MPSRKFSTQERDEFLAKIDAQKKASDERHLKINRAYHRTPLYVATLVMRILFFAFFIWIFFWSGGSGKVTQENVIRSEKSIYLTYANVKVEKLSFDTPAGHYEAIFDGKIMPFLKEGMVLNIEHNLVGKPSYFWRENEDARHPFALSWILYIFIGVITVMSFKFNDALESVDHKFLWITWVANLFAFGHYFLS